MPQVPYNPVPQGTPTAPDVQVHEQTPGAAFGENIGEAISKIGGTLGQSGNEIFDRALGLQQLANETSARNGAIAYGKQQELDRAQFEFDNPGLTARDNLKPFLDQSDKLRQKYREGLNPAAARMYDEYSSSFFLRNINSAASHAGA